VGRRYLHLPDRRLAGQALRRSGLRLTLLTDNVELAGYEDDWWAIRRDAGFSGCFAHHYDPTDPNPPTKHVSPGCIYTTEAALATTPAPYSDELLEHYVGNLMAKAAEPDSVMLRAMGANQAAVVDKFDAVLDLEAGADVLKERNDKLYDIGRELVEQLSESQVRARYSWLGPTLGNVLCGYSLMVAHSLSAAVMRKLAMAAGAGMAAGIAGGGAQVVRLLERLQGMQLIQRTHELALQSVVSGGGLRTPMQIGKTYPLAKGMALLEQRQGISRSQLIDVRRAGKIRLTLLTDNHELAAFGGDVDRAVAGGAGKVELAHRPTPALLKPSALAATVVLSDAQYEALWRRGPDNFAKAAQLAETGAGGMRAVFGSLDGRYSLHSPSGLGKEDVSRVPYIKDIRFHLTYQPNTKVWPDFKLEASR
jgi:hypothetical protein